MTEKASIATVDERGVGRITLNRPDIHNAFDDGLIALLTEQFLAMAKDDAVRVVVLASTGKSYSAGADLNWMKRMAAYGRAENKADSLKLAALFEAIDTCPKPTVALVQGACFGGGVGLVAACDIAIASDKASFCLSEVRLGILPAVISPYVVAAIGTRQSRRYMLTAERFSAQAGLVIGMVHEMVAPDELESAGQKMVDILLANGPNALAACKELIAFVAHGAVDEKMMDGTAQRIADARATIEGQEGLSAFFEKRKPSWVKG